MLHDKDLVSSQEVRTKVEKAHAAFQKYPSYNQQQVDAIVEAHGARPARANARRLAEMAVEETGYGNVQDKIVKNLLNCRPAAASHSRHEDGRGAARGAREAAWWRSAFRWEWWRRILPTTNPTSTAIYKIADLAQGRQRHRDQPASARPQVHLRTADVLYQAAVEAGAPEDIIQCIDGATHGSHPRADEARAHRRDPGDRRAAHGEGGLFERQAGVRRRAGQRAGATWNASADVADAVGKVVVGQVVRLRHGLLERAGAGGRGIASATGSLAELKQHKAYFCNEAQKRGARRRLLITPNWTINPQCVGQSPTNIAEDGRLRSARRTPRSSWPKLTAWASSIRSRRRSSRRCWRCTSCADFAAALDTCEALLQLRRPGPHLRDPLERRRAHSRVRAAHAGHARAGEHVVAAGLRRASPPTCCLR